MKKLKNNKLFMLGLGSFVVGNAFKHMNSAVLDHVSCFMVGFSFSIIIVAIIKEYTLKESM